MPDRLKREIEQAAIVAHQIKSPVGTLQTILRTLLGGFAGDLTDRQRLMVESADRKCSEAVDTIKGLLALADASGHGPGDAVSELVSAAREVCERYRAAAEDKQLDLVYRPEMDEAYVQAQPASMLEAIAALVDNAVKYTPQAGRVIVRIAPMEEGGVGLWIVDSGIGVPRQEWDGLFRPFFRASNAKKLMRAGTGLGLPFVKAVIEAAGGSITAGRSELGGMEFAVSLPHVPRPEGLGGPDLEWGEPSFRAVVIGGVAAGPKVATKLMRVAPNAEVTIIERGRVLSYAGCGLPHYISGRVRDQSQLFSTAGGVVRGPEYFQRVKNVHVMHRTEALKIDRRGKRVLIKDLITGRESWLPYDKLALATGSAPVVPDIPGVDIKNVFTLHGLEHAEGIKAMVAAGRAVDVTIVGGGLIGVEVTESLVLAACRVTLVEAEGQLLRNLDREMAEHVRRHLESKGVRVMLNTRVTAFEGDGRLERIVTKDGSWPADMVIIGVSVRPNSRLAAEAGIEIGATGAVKVDDHMRTSDPDIYAAGDCVECRNILTGREMYAPFGGNANRQARVAAENICGGDVTFPGVLGTSLCKVFDLTVGRTGLTERAARNLGHDVVTALVPALDRAHFMPNAAVVMIKLIADTATRRLLGVQTLGHGDVPKRLDVAVTALTAGLTVDDVSNLDLGYAPAYSTALDNIHTACNVAKNKLDGRMDGISPMELRARLDGGEDIVLLDVRTHADLEEMPLGSCKHIPMPALRGRLNELDPDKEIVVYSQASLSAYEASIILRAHGFEHVRVLDGGIWMWPYG